MPYSGIAKIEIQKKMQMDNSNISESLKWHLEKNIGVVSNIFRPTSRSFFEIINEARMLYIDGSISLNENDRIVLDETDIGKFGMFRGKHVPLDMPMWKEEDVSEAEYKGRNVELNKPKRGGKKKYYVYTINPETKKVIKISFGDVHGGLTAKVSDAQARKSFAARHKCSTKKDKTKAGYWACRINRYGYLWGGKTYPGYW
jgi:hypothetical protein